MVVAAPHKARLRLPVRSDGGRERIHFIVHLRQSVAETNNNGHTTQSGSAFKHRIFVWKKSDVRDLDGTAAVLFLLFRVSAGVRL